MMKPGTHVRVVVRSSLYATPDKPTYEWTGTVTESDFDGIWAARDDEPEREEFVSYLDVEDVQVL